MRTGCPLHSTRKATAIAAIALIAAPAAGQSPSLDTPGARLDLVPDAPVARNSGLSVRQSEWREPDGTFSIRRGIIAGFEISPNAIAGIGLFEVLPREKIRSEFDPTVRTPKRSRKAAVGITFKF